MALAMASGVPGDATIADIRLQPAFREILGEHTRPPDALLAAILNLDWAVAVSPSMLPDNLAHVSELAERVVAQIDEVIDVAKPTADRYPKNEGDAVPVAGPRRCLKLLLRCGEKTAVAMEHRPCPQLSMATPAGSKIVLRKGLQVRRGLVLLRPEGVDVIGSGVPELMEAHRRAVASAHAPLFSTRAKGAAPANLAADGNPRLARMAQAAWNNGGGGGTQGAAPSSSAAAAAAAAAPAPSHPPMPRAQPQPQPPQPPPPHHHQHHNHPHPHPHHYQQQQQQQQQQRQFHSMGPISTSAVVVGEMDDDGFCEAVPFHHRLSSTDDDSDFCEIVEDRPAPRQPQPQPQPQPRPPAPARRTYNMLEPSRPNLTDLTDVTAHVAAPAVPLETPTLCPDRLIDIYEGRISHPRTFQCYGSFRSVETAGGGGWDAVFDDGSLGLAVHIERECASSADALLAFEGIVDLRVTPSASASDSSRRYDVMRLGAGLGRDRCLHLLERLEKRRRL
ncbi:hypothetical protein PPROV_000575600 [Pycnococcus provasolii]|uniref:RecQ-mediated genome instability protein 1 n=1 Tax=Pycnococcus provasolii TaxID=41880 RepID=A0A830HK91_9CHLO|nr:hypothetical protein PPROV_000575600 [Pycnococcus provasolii]